MRSMKSTLLYWDGGKGRGHKKQQRGEDLFHFSSKAKGYRLLLRSETESLMKAKNEIQSKMKGLSAVTRNKGGGRAKGWRFFNNKVERWQLKGGAISSALPYLQKKKRKNRSNITNRNTGIRRRVGGFQARKKKKKNGKGPEI